MNVLSAILQIGGLLLAIVLFIAFQKAADQAKEDRQAALDRKMERDRAEFEKSPLFRTMLRNNPAWVARLKAGDE